MYQKKCRICLVESFHDLLPLFSPIKTLNNSLTNAELLMACSSIQITENDGYPQNICRICYNKLLQSYEFKLLCENSDKMLRSVLKQEEIDINEIYLEENYQFDDDEIVGDENFESDMKIETMEINISNNSKNKIVYKEHFTFCSKQIEALNKMKEDIKKLTEKHIKFENDNFIKKIHFTCTKCNKKFITRDQLKKHINRTHKSIVSTSHLRKSMSNGGKTGDIKELFRKRGLYQCLICNEHFKNILAHYRQEHKVKKCPDCSKKFIKYNFFIRHMRECRNPLKPKNPYSQTKQKHLCPYCGHCFAESANLKAHIRIHTGEKPYKCEWCDKKFAQWASLSSHRFVHTGEKNYRCEVCGKAFARSYALRKHMSSHSDELLYSCDVCEKKFKHAKSVKDHMVVHTGVKDFNCEYCGRAFGFKKNLVVHRRIHTGEKPYVCEICSQGFRQAHCLRGHMKSQHKQSTIVTSDKDYSLTDDLKSTEFLS